MPVGSAQAYNYVVGELARRTLGRHLKRMQKNPNPIPPTAETMLHLPNWWHQRTPWIRAVSNAVPHEHADKMDQWEEAKEMFGGEITADTRFHHVLWGGVGLKVDKGVELQHDWNNIYTQPFNTETPYRGNKPMPGITQANISFLSRGGMGGSLKKGVVDFKCYSLADLDRLEKLYMHPGMKILLEWGWSKNTHGVGFTHEECNPISLDDTILNSSSKVHQEIMEKRKLSGGCYDAMFGYIVNFSWDIQSDLSFNCRFDITDRGDSVFFIDTNTPFQNQKVSNEGEADDTGFTLKTALQGIRSKLEDSKKSASGTIETKSIDFEQTLGVIDFTYFRNKYGTPTKQHPDSKDKKGNIFRTYIRFGDIVDKLINQLYIITSDASRTDAANGSTEEAPITQALSQVSIGDVEIVTVDIGATDTAGDSTPIPDKPISVISNHPYLISTDPDICLLPGQIGSAPYNVKAAMSDSKRGGGSVTSRSFPSGIDANPDYLFNCSTDKAEAINTSATAAFDESKKTVGLLANIFVNLEMMIEVCKTTTNVGEFLERVTSKLSDACGSIWTLKWTILEEYPDCMTCIDMNFVWGGELIVLELPVANLSGIVRSFQVKSTINNSTAMQMFIASNTTLTGDTVEKSPIQDNVVPVSVDFELDGISGIQYGTTFAIDYLPSKYRKQTYLSAKGVSHTITPSGWITAVNCQFKLAHSDNPFYKINLGKVIELQESDVGSDRDIARALKEEVTMSKDKALEVQVDAKGAQVPVNVFQSLESVGLTVGATAADAIDSGKTSGSEDKDRETIEGLAPRLEDVMSKLYGKGTSGAVEDIANADAILQKILYLPIEGSTAESPPSTSSTSTDNNKVVAT